MSPQQVAVGNHDSNCSRIRVPFSEKESEWDTTDTRPIRFSQMERLYSQARLGRSAKGKKRGREERFIDRRGEREKRRLERGRESERDP